MEDHIKAIAQRLAGLREVMQLSIEDFAEKCQIDAETYRKATLAILPMPTISF